MFSNVPAEPDLVYAGSFVGSDDGDEVNATFASLPLSCGRAGAHAVPPRKLASPTIENSNRMMAWLRGMGVLREAIRWAA